MLTDAGRFMIPIAMVRLQRRMWQMLDVDGDSRRPEAAAQAKHTNVDTRAATTT